MMIADLGSAADALVPTYGSAATARGAWPDPAAGNVPPLVAVFDDDTGRRSMLRYDTDARSWVPVPRRAA